MSLNASTMLLVHVASFIPSLLTSSSLSNIFSLSLWQVFMWPPKYQFFGFQHIQSSLAYLLRLNNSILKTIPGLPILSGTN